MAEAANPAVVRVDQWVWAVRVVKTRALAAAACRAGHVEVNGRSAKPATPVRIGDVVRARVGPRVYELEVSRLVDKRVGPPVAATCFVDRSPAPAVAEALASARDRGAGRPTKRDRRRIDQLRGR